MLNLFWETQVWLITSRTIIHYRPKFQNNWDSFHLVPKYLTSQLLTLQGTQRLSSIAAQNAQPILGNFWCSNWKKLYFRKILSLLSLCIPKVMLNKTFYGRNLPWQARVFVTGFHFYTSILFTGKTGWGHYNATVWPID